MIFIIIKSERDVNKLMEWVHNKHSIKDIIISFMYNGDMPKNEKQFSCAITIDDLYLISNLIHKREILWTPILLIIF